ncbi:MAG: hypothetical protein DSY34_00645 [Desulfurobacterium sp.]|nr:MAG: hypothetical protein DSY34_00645 [Desulfurobacterium sp.]
MKLEILKAYEVFRKRNPHLKETEAKEEFVKLFNSGKIHVSFEAVECGIHKITVKSLYRWIKLREEGGLAALLPKHSEKGRRKKITREIELFVFEYIKKTGITRGKRVYEAIRYHHSNGKLSTPPPSYQAFMSWYREWKKRNELFILKYTDPDNYRRKLPSYGSIYASYDPEYYGQVLMLDATKADVMCRWKEKQPDGSYIEKEKRLSLSILIDLYSRDIRFALGENENALLVVNNLLRKWILEVGVPEVIVTDNSKIYRSEHLAQVCEALGIKLTHTDSYAPEQKPHVERVFGTIATQLFEVLEGYVGHNVAERKKIESRKKFRDKIFKKKDYFIEVYLTPEEFEKKLSDYVKKRYRKEKHSFGIIEQLILNSPRKPKTIKDERVLDILLSKFERRTLSNKGIRLHNRYYFSKELAEIYYQQGSVPVLVKYDISDISTIYVFDEKGRYLCKAFDHQEAGKRLEEAIKAKKVFKKKEKELEKLIKQNQKLSATPYEIATSIYSFEADHKVIPFDRRPQEELETETVREAKKIVKETEETRKLIEETAKDTFFTSPLKRAKALFRKIEKGEAITKEDYAFLKAYVESEEFRKYSRMEVFGRTFKNLKSIEELDIKLA